MNPLLCLHIGGGAIGLLSGAVALAVRKGGPVHRVSGDVFVIAMIVMGGASAWLSAAIADWKNLPGGLFTAYLVMTAWATLARNEALARVGEHVALVLGGAAAASAVLLAVQGKAGAPGLLITAGLAAFAIVLDLRALGAGDARPARNLPRHIWRMCTALFIASGSFFLGQQQVMPLWLRGSPLLVVPAVAPLALMVFWLARTALSRSLRPRAATA